MNTYIITLNFPYAFYDITTSQKMRKFVEKFTGIECEFSGTGLETMRSHLSYEINTTQNVIDSMMGEISSVFEEFFGGESWSFLASPR